LPAELPSEPHDSASDHAPVDKFPPQDDIVIPAADYHAARVLLVDDDVRNLLSLTPLLERWNLRVMAAGDGMEALETLATDGEFSLVIMDIMMPGMDGNETIRRIRQQARLRDVPVIALTAKSAAADLQLCRESGANACLVKPVDITELKHLLDSYLFQGDGTGEH
jgi:tubulin-specific chaperone A